MIKKFLSNFIFILTDVRKYIFEMDDTSSEKFNKKKKKGNITQVYIFWLAFDKRSILNSLITYYFRGWVEFYIIVLTVYLRLQTGAEERIWWKVVLSWRPRALCSGWCGRSRDRQMDLRQWWPPRSRISAPRCSAYPMGPSKRPVGPALANTGDEVRKLLMTR